MKTVFVVTIDQGGTIYAVFDSKPVAEELVAAFGGDAAIEEAPFNPDIGDLNAQGDRVFYIRMAHDGTIIRKATMPATPDYATFYKISPNSHILDTQLPPHEMHLWAGVLAKNEEEAITWVNAKRVQLLADNQWVYSFAPVSV